MAFPSLSRRPKSEKKIARDNAIKVDFEGGYQHRRPRYTRDVFNFELVYDLLQTADAEALANHYNEVGTGYSFNWTDREGNVRDVYYDEPLEIAMVYPGWFQVSSIKLREV